MKSSAVVIDPVYLKHLPGQGHPERPERIEALLGLARQLDPAAFAVLSPEAASRAAIKRIHGADYIRLVESTSSVNRYALDGDTITCRDSFGVGLLAVGGFLKMLDGIAAGEHQNGFALVRPPGHHALRDRTMGFCLFNTMAIGAEHLRQGHGAKKILIVDWDVHHGNGTQSVFYDDPSILFISTHQFPFYPGSGAVNEIGAGAGEGFTINVPLPAGCANRQYLQVFQDVIVPAVENFEPEWILVSAGFDPHRRDPLAGMAVTEEGFAAMARVLLLLADRFCGGRIGFLLEGGYDLHGLRDSVAAVLTEMRSPARAALDPLAPSESGLGPLLGRLAEVHEKYR